MQVNIDPNELEGFRGILNFIVVGVIIVTILGSAYCLYKLYKSKE